MPPFVTTTDYARHRGINPRSVRQAIQEGRLARSVRREGRRFLIDTELADREWTASTDPGRGGKRHSRAGDAEYSEARRRRVIIESDLLALQVAEREAQLVNAAAVETARRQTAQRVRAELLRLPDELAPLIAAEADAFKVHAIITAALRAALVRLSSES